MNLRDTFCFCFFCDVKMQQQQALLIEPKHGFEKIPSKVSTYSIKMEYFDDGSTTMTRINDGFDPLQLLGLSDFIGIEIRDQILWKIKPDVIKRSVLKD